LKFSKSNIRKAAIIAVVQAVLLLVLFIYCYDHIKKVIYETDRKNEADLNPRINDVGLTKIDWNQVKRSNPQPINGGSI